MAAKRSADDGDKPALHLVKLCVGAEDIEDLVDWQKRFSAQLKREMGDPRPRHRTRMQPKRGAELLAGGSLYWVIKGVVRCRQRLLALEPIVCGDGLTRTDLVLDKRIVPVAPRPMRPFQGWRYLPESDAPADVSDPAAGRREALPRQLEQALVEIGVV